jgi:hypothetical protein
VRTFEAKIEPRPYVAGTFPVSLEADYVIVEM